ncbi:MAG: phosphoribosylformylglycinamidine synthase [Parcubacteria group bacterium Gr01-1014_8]|nr:MAG: phosphoribosylformylglycinamidine synthase [Parcubacteria group bacterium Gr01-1014_8]
MITRVTVRAKREDARADGYLRTLKNRFPKVKLKGVAVTEAYTIDAKLLPKELEKIAKGLANPIIEEYATKGVLAPETFSVAVEIGFLPGVTDNVGHTVREMIEDTTGRKFKDAAAVYTSRFLFLTGSTATDEAARMAREFYNPLIQRASVLSYSEFKKGVPIIVPKVELHSTVKTDEVNLEVDDDELMRIGKEGIVNKDNTRQGPLALSLRAMHIIRDYFRTIGRDPTDVELEALAQTWSEHCKHTIFADPLDEIEEGIYRRYIKGATQKIRKDKGKKDFCVSVFTDNSGGIAFDDKYLVTHKVETHNSPSALDPFGGAITDIVGVNRDCLGFGLGAKPIANVYGFCVADPTDETPYFRDKEKTQPLLSNRRILEGIVQGINAGGNQSGIPTPLGFVAVDPSFRSKPLVYGGTVGLIPRKSHGRKLHEKEARAGDYVVMIGGKVGLDGIHGATFSSEALAKGSPATAVQIGDPITQKKFSDAIVREARDAGLFNSITDNGAGGLSSSVGEMAKDSGGFVVDLEKVPLKYPGLSPWQIWISESQERMTLSVPKSKWNALKKIFDRHGVDAWRIGEFTKSGKAIVRWRGTKVMDMDMKFLHDGRPIEEQKSQPVLRTFAEPLPEERPKDLGKTLVEMLARPSIGSISFISQQYDHEVLAMAVTKPLQGRGRVNADSGVIQPLPHSNRGVVLAHGYAPWYSNIDTYAMAAASIDAAIRNAVAAGASLDHLAILDNFCWSSSNEPGRLYELKRAAEACYDIAVAYGTPYISGKDSMFNDFRGYTESDVQIHIAALPTLLISAIGVIPDVRKAVTLDAKQPGDLVYLIGDTNDELGASEYFTMLSERTSTYEVDRDDRHTMSNIGSNVPRVDTTKNMKTYKALEKAIQKGLVASAISVGRGGLAVALAKTAIAGKLGINADLTKLLGTAGTDDSRLFSESQGRVLVSVNSKLKREFEKSCQGSTLTLVGEVMKRNSLEVDLSEKRLNIPLKMLSAAYQKPFKNW